MGNHDDEFEREHPSYGILHISRISGGSGARLFGSPLASHYQTFRLSISKATWSHGLHHDRFFGMSKDHIEIELSAAQFVDAITSLNMGSGTPCTIRYVQGQRVEDPPDYATEAEHIRENFSASLDKAAARTNEYRKTIDAEIAKAKLSEKVRSKIKTALDVMEQALTSNVPFIVKQFQEATTRITTAAKAEVDAFVSGVIHRAGLDAIAEGRLPSLLPPSTDEARLIERAKTREIVKAGVCPACLSHGDCIAQCPNAGDPRCNRDHFQNCEALLTADDDACDCGKLTITEHDA